MRKVVSVSILAIAAICISACQKELVQNSDITEYNRVVFSVDDFDFEGAPVTKLTPDISSSGVSYLWAQGDTVGIYPDAGSQLVFPVAEFGSTTAAFDGGAWNLSSEHSYYAYVPYVPDIRLDRSKVPVSFLGQHQSQNADASGLRDYVFMAASGTPPAGRDLIFNFKRLGCLLWINLNVPADVYTSLSMSVEDGTALPVQGTFDLSSTTSEAAPDLTVTKSSADLTLKLDNISVTQDNSTLTCYMMTAPVDLTGKTVKFSLVGNNGRTVYAVAGKNLKKSGATRFNPTELVDIIDFKDQYVHDKCVSLWDTNGNGELDYPEAAVVTEISERCFQGRGISSFDELQYFTSLESIGSRAFYSCSNLLSIDFPDGNALSIGEEAFMDCKKLDMVDDYLLLSSVGPYAFQHCNAITGGIRFTDTARTISDGAFGSCFKLTTIDIPNNIEYIGSYAFQWCTSLQSITLPENVDVGPYQVFEACKSITSINIPSHWTEFGDGLFMYCSGLTSFEVPENIVSLGDRCFLGCNNLASITLHDSLLNIREDCFKYCSSLGAITIPSKIKTIHHGTFYGCSSLSNIVLPEGLVAIVSRGSGAGAFEHCTSLESITLPSTLASIGEYTFCSSGLISIEIPNNVTYLGKAAFEGCDHLTNCILPNKITNLSRGLFYGTIISTLTIPATVESIYTPLPTSLTELYLLPTTPPSLLENKCIPDNDCPIYVPAASVEAYKSAPIWSNFADRIQAIPGGGAGGNSGDPDNWS